VVPGLCAFFSGGLEPGYNCTQQTLHYSVEHGDHLCFFLNLKKKKKKKTKIFLVFSSVHGQHLTPRFIYLFIYFSPLGFVMLKNLAKSSIKYEKINQIYTFKKKISIFF
jgi:hypothetical protein